MQVPIFRLKEKNGYILYRREKTKFKNTVPLLKYYIVNGVDYYKEFKSSPSANKAFKELTETLPTTVRELPDVSRFGNLFVNESGHPDTGRVQIGSKHDYIAEMYEGDDPHNEPEDNISHDEALALATELVRRWNIYPGNIRFGMWLAENGWQFYDGDDRLINIKLNNIVALITELFEDYKKENIEP